MSYVGTFDTYTLQSAVILLQYCCDAIACKSEHVHTRVVMSRRRSYSNAFVDSGHACQFWCLSLKVDTSLCAAVETVVNYAVISCLSMRNLETAVFLCWLKRNDSNTDRQISPGPELSSPTD